MKTTKTIAALAATLNIATRTADPAKVADRKAKADAWTAKREEWLLNREAILIAGEQVTVCKGKESKCKGFGMQMTMAVGAVRLAEGLGRTLYMLPAEFIARFDFSSADARMVLMQLATENKLDAKVFVRAFNQEPVGGKCFECGRAMSLEECGDETPEERICDECAVPNKVDLNANYTKDPSDCPDPDKVVAEPMTPPPVFAQPNRMSRKSGTAKSATKPPTAPKKAAKPRKARRTSKATKAS